MVAPQQFTKVDLTPKRYHGYAVLLFILGTLFPPLAVAARFGIGKDFWLNLVLTICGYIPGHGHNFYIQNIRNNKTHQRTPKWAQRYGLVDTSEIKRKERKSQWASRYNDRLPRSTLENAPYEEGQVEGGSSVDLSLEGQDSRLQQQRTGEYWTPSDERYYGQNSDRASVASSGRWHYPANFDDAVPEPGAARKKSKKKKEKKDRWARTEDAYSITNQSQEGVGGGERSSKRRKSKKRRSTVTAGDEDTYSRTSGSTTEFPEDPEGGLYGPPPKKPGQEEMRRDEGDDIFTHEL